MSALAQGRIDGAGRLVEAELPLQRLQESAGSALGQPVAVPQIATMARLAQRLGVLVSRCVVAAEGADDLDLWVEAKPDGEGVLLSVGGWARRPARPGSGGDRVHDFMRTRGDLLWETDAQLRVTSFGDGEDGLGQPLGKLFQFVDGGDQGLPILEALATRARFEGQEALIRATGERVRLTGLPLVDGGGRFAGYRGSAFRLDGEPASANDGAPNPFGARLERALREPLSRIVAQAESIGAQEDGPIRRDYADYAHDIANAGRHLLGLVGDLVDLQAIERDDFRPAAERIDLAQLARRAAGLLKVRAAQRQVRIDAPGADEEIPVLGDTGRVIQILVNLIGNAIRHSPENSAVWLRIEERDGRAELVVADQGDGIAAADHERVFEKFVRLSQDSEPGSGLGLYIARRLARAMRGDVSVDSAPGQGARFTLSLPIA